MQMAHHWEFAEQPARCRIQPASGSKSPVRVWLCAMAGSLWRRFPGFFSELLSMKPDARSPPGPPVADFQSAQGCLRVPLHGCPGAAIQASSVLERAAACRSAVIANRDLSLETVLAGTGMTSLPSSPHPRRQAGDRHGQPQTSGVSSWPQQEPPPLAQVQGQMLSGQRGQLRPRTMTTDNDQGQ
jgi:hypothetical protein